MIEYLGIIMILILASCLIFLAYDTLKQMKNLNTK